MVRFCLSLHFVDGNCDGVHTGLVVSQASCCNPVHVEFRAGFSPYEGPVGMRLGWLLKLPQGDYYLQVIF